MVLIYVHKALESQCQTGLRVPSRRVEKKRSLPRCESDGASVTQSTLSKNRHSQCRKSAEDNNRVI